MIKNSSKTTTITRLQKRKTQKNNRKIRTNRKKGQNIQAFTTSKESSLRRSTIEKHCALTQKTNYTSKKQLTISKKLQKCLQELDQNDTQMHRLLSYKIVISRIQQFSFHKYSQFLKYLMNTNNQKSMNSIVIKRIREHGAKHKIEELCLDEIPLLTLTLDLTFLIEKCTRIEYLSLCSCSLSNLNNLPTLPQLQVLQLQSNQLQSEHLEPLTKYAKLYSLDLNLNKISDFSWTRFLKRLRISEISLKEPEYREKIFKALGVDLETLDGLDRMGNAADDLSISESDEEEDEYSDEVKQDEKQSQSEGQSHSVSISPESIDEDRPSNKPSKQEPQKEE